MNNAEIIELIKANSELLDFMAYGELNKELIQTQINENKAAILKLENDK